MPIKSYKPTTPSRRAMTQSTFSEITTSTPEKSLLVSIKKTGGRNNTVFSFVTTADVTACDSTSIITSTSFFN